MNVLKTMVAVSTHAVIQKGAMTVPALTTTFSAAMDTTALVCIYMYLNITTTVGSACMQ